MSESGHYDFRVGPDGKLQTEDARRVFPSPTRRDQEKKETKPAVAQPKQNTSRQ